MQLGHYFSSLAIDFPSALVITVETILQEKQLISSERMPLLVYCLLFVAFSAWSFGDEIGFQSNVSLLLCFNTYCPKAMRVGSMCQVQTTQ